MIKITRVIRGAGVGGGVMENKLVLSPFTGLEIESAFHVLLIGDKSVIS